MHCFQRKHPTRASELRRKAGFFEAIFFVPGRDRGHPGLKVRPDGFAHFLGFELGVGFPAQIKQVHQRSGIRRHHPVLPHVKGDQPSGKLRKMKSRYVHTLVDVFCFK